MWGKRFFDVPVYRLARDRYQHQLSSKIDRDMEIFAGSDIPEDILSRNRKMRVEHQRLKYGTWDFNEIVGYIRLYFRGSQVLGEYFSAEKKRTVLTRRKVFLYETYKLATEGSIPANATNEEIFNCIIEYTQRCEKELTRGRFVETAFLEQLGPHVDWDALRRED